MPKPPVKSKGFSTFLVEVWRCSLREDILLLRLTSELVDLRKEYANSILLRRVKFSSPTPAKKKKRTTRALFSFFMVEVWRFELQASSTRNWRATNCATPRNGEKY